METSSECMAEIYNSKSVRSGVRIDREFVWSFDRRSVDRTEKKQVGGHRFNLLYHVYSVFLIRMVVFNPTNSTCRAKYKLVDFFFAIPAESSLRVYTFTMQIFV